MSTDLYGIRVLEVDPTHARLRLRVFVVYYDVSYSSHQPLPYDRSFFMRVLCDRGALDDEVTTNEYLDESFVNRNTFRYMERFETLETRNEPVTSYEGFSDFYYERDGGWSDEESLVQGDYDVFVTNPGYLAAFSVGDSWGTTSYVTDSDDLALDDYKNLPDLDDVVLMLSPFMDRSYDSANVDDMAFSPDGSMLACTNDEGTLRVFSIPQGEQLLEVKDVTQWWGGLGWTPDGGLAMGFEAGHNKVDSITGEVTFVEYAGCPAHPSGAVFFHNPMDANSVYIKDADGKVLYEHDHEEDSTAFLSVDASGDFALLALESKGLFLVDVPAGTSTPILAPTLQGLTFNRTVLSPDARYIIAEIQGTSRGIQVVEIATGKVLREQPMTGYLTVVSWSMDNRFVGVGSSDSNGFNTRVYIHRTGEGVEASLEDSLSAPEPDQGDSVEALERLARLFLEKTARFSAGWNTHLDDTLSTFHLTLLRKGSALDLVPQMKSAARQVDTRARESIWAAKLGDSLRAKRALEDAHQRLKQIHKLQPWFYPTAHAMLGAADYLQGHTERAQESFDALQTYFADQEPHQHLYMLMHAALIMEKEDVVRELIRGHVCERVGPPETIILKILFNEGRFDLFVMAVNQWASALDQNRVGLSCIQGIMAHCGEVEHAYRLDWFELGFAQSHDRNTMLKWFAEHLANGAKPWSITQSGDDFHSVEEAKHFEFLVRPDDVMAQEGFDLGDMSNDVVTIVGLLRSSNPQAGVALLTDVGEYEHTTMLKDLAILGAFELMQATPFEPAPPKLLPYFLAMRGDSRALYAHLNTLKRTQRSTLYPVLAQIAWLRKDTAVTLNFIGKMRFGDMGAPGIQAIQQAFAHLAGPAYRNMNN